MHLGFVFSGWLSIASTLFLSAIALYLGIGLLRRKRQSPRFAMCYVLYLLLDNVVFLIRPDRNERVSAYNNALAASIPPTASRFSATSMSHLLQLSSIEWGLIALVIVWLLAKNKQTFAAGHESRRELS
jgi:hypothetical protein